MQRNISKISFQHGISHFFHLSKHLRSFFSYKVLKIWCVFYLSAHVESDRPHSTWLVAAVLNGTGLKAEQRDTRGAGEHRRVTYSKTQVSQAGFLEARMPRAASGLSLSLPPGLQEELSEEDL